mmetsp:Transcript_12317/g.18450  ORF Transcript_12317/g.18450 Transcript_12317/m.18450 type:complete len:98 (-) Transcript_12317:50-343(-)
MASRLFPILDRIVVRRAAAELKTAGGILLPENASKASEAVVVAVGPGPRGKDGNYLPMALQKGDKVILPEYGGQKLKIDNEELFVYREDDIVAKLDN